LSSAILSAQIDRASVVGSAAMQSRNLDSGMLGHHRNPSSVSASPINIQDYMQNTQD